MLIDEAYLTEMRQRAEAQRQKLVAELNQATGAIGMLDMLLQRLQEPEASGETEPTGFDRS